ncbi:type I-F CRISPR-associated protein Csy1 [Caballeronia sp. GAFFF2]|jgi:CRISPR-associated protein Csy1|uniref:type I-F CRISPR-associated protein Csy1 n=1 Tax=Caballeronia sp. GAFFF2 TaxID=2921741 RepID=UPI002028A7E7|nr:type I-F CRISPR-associated protein Csy1 [Caballeronia sp. GAFFF2]
MSDKNAPEAHSCYRAAIDAFLHDRLQAKLDKLPLDDAKRAELIAEHQRGPWIESAAKRVVQIQAVTHSLKPIHSEARGTSLFVKPSSLSTLDVFGSHALGNRFDMDVTGNAAALDVYKLLKLEVGGISLLEALIANDRQALDALNDDLVKASILRDAFIGLTAEREGGASSHVCAKHLYWLIGDDANDDAQYHLIAPLYPTSLAQRVYEDVQDARFGEANKLARRARREGLPHDGVDREYHDLAVQELGGTKPQNISICTSERGGKNYLLSSLPPIWKGKGNYLPAHTTSVFERTLAARRSVRAAVRRFQEHLLSGRPGNMRFRDRTDRLWDRIVDELVVYAGELLLQPAGWTRDTAFEKLVEEEQLWLDPLRAEIPEEADFRDRWLNTNWSEKIGSRFANWINSELQEKLLDVGSDEAREWRGRLQDEATIWEEHVPELRDRLNVLSKTFLRKAHGELIQGHDRA